MPSYRCDDLGPIEAHSIDAAAEQFARRLARREFGPKGTTNRLECTGRRQDGRTAFYTVHIGVPVGKSDPGTRRGRDVHLCVVRD